MAVNYDDVLAQLRTAGLLVDHFDVGRMQRCRVEGEKREKRGWYSLHEIRTDAGTDLIVGSYGVWRGNENNVQKIELRDHKIGREQSDSLRKRLAEDRKRADLQRQQEAARAGARAAQVWRSATEQGECDYLAKKGVAAHGVRFTAKASMLIPLLDAAGRIHGLQVIRSSAQQNARRALQKEFWPAGLIKKGRFHLLGMPLPGGVLLLAEGYATAASLHEATGLPVAVAFDAGNLVHVATALHKRYRQARILICADDDVTQKCQECRTRVWLSDGPTCHACGKEHRAANAGLACASTAAMQVGGAWIQPHFADETARRAGWIEHGRKLNDFNDLHAAEGLHVVRQQVEARLLALNWRAVASPRATAIQGGGASAGAPPDRLRPIDSLDELLERFALVYGQGGTVFDRQEHMLLPIGDMRDACLTRELHRAWADHPDRCLVRVQEVGFDPSCTDPEIQCNLWAGWPTQPAAGDCTHLLDLLRYMCAEDAHPEQLFQWVLRWIAYPIQHPGAKLKTTIVIHGPQGTGKNMFFEALMAIYGRYGRVIDQSALEDKFNDWASRKLLLIADEVVARSDLYHVKNKLKAFISGEWIRINPKNMAAYDERNHANMVFLSNESMPVVLEEDDRRHAVIWTPAKLSADFYQGVLAEIRGGGIAALHDHLLHLDLGDFDPGTLPPMTDAKRELINLSKDSPSRFVDAFQAGDVEGFPAANAPRLLLPALSSDFYELYTHWCRRAGLKALNQPRFANAIMRKNAARTERKRYALDMATKGPSAVTYLPGSHELPPGHSETDWLGERIEVFRAALKDYRSKEFSR